MRSSTHYITCTALTSYQEAQHRLVRNQACCVLRSIQLLHELEASQLQLHKVIQNTQLGLSLKVNVPMRRCSFLNRLTGVQDWVASMLA